MKIERLAGMPGKTNVEALCGNHWCVCQSCEVEGVEHIYGPTLNDERAAIRAWNAMVRRIRKANAGGQP